MELVIYIKPFLLFIISLALLIKSADLFVDFAERIGGQLKIPHFVIGVLIIAIGTSLPELATTIAAILRSTAEDDLTPLVSANIIGSNIANILLGIGIASLFRTVKVQRDLINVDLPYLFASTAILCFFLWDGLLSRGEGILLFIMFIVFISFSIFGLHIKEDNELDHVNKESIPKLIILLILSGFVIMFTSDWTIVNLEKIALNLGMEPSIASMVFLAIGTSFPEIMVGVVMVRKGLFAMAVGNILGSNIANSLGVMSIAGMLSPLNVSEESIRIGIPFLLIATMYFIFASMDKIFPKWEGLMAIAIFIIFLGKILNFI